MEHKARYARGLKITGTVTLLLGGVSLLGGAIGAITGDLAILFFWPSLIYFLNYRKHK